MNELEVKRDFKNEMKNALMLHEKEGVAGKGAATFTGMALAGGTLIAIGIANPLILIPAMIGSTAITRKVNEIYQSYKHRTYILKPKPTINNGKLFFETYNVYDIPQNFLQIFEKGNLHKLLHPIQFIELYNGVIERYYSTGEGNLFRELVDTIILNQLGERLRENKIKINPTIADIYYSLKYEYSERDDINNFSKRDYRKVVKSIADNISNENKEWIFSFTGFDLDKFAKDSNKPEKINMPHPELHKYISRLYGDVFSFFIPGFDTFNTFDQTGACKEFYSMGIDELLKKTYNSRIVLKYLGRFTDENELDFRRFIDIVDEAKKDLSDNSVICKIVEYFSIIESKFEDAEKLLVEYKNNPKNFNNNDTELLNLKLDSLIRQSKGVDTGQI